MSLASSFSRFMKTLFGQVEGKTERLADQMVTASPEAISNQYRKIREDQSRDHEEMKKAVANLMTLQDGRKKTLQEIQMKRAEYQSGMDGATEEFRRTQDTRAREAFGMLAEEKEKADARALELNNEIEAQEKVILKYKEKLKEMSKAIQDLKAEEAQAVLDITSQRQIKAVSDRLAGISTNAHDKSLIAIREAAQSAKSQLKLDTDLSSNSTDDYLARVTKAGQNSKYLSAFDEAVKIDTVFPETPKALSSPKKEEALRPAADALDKLFD